MCAALFSNGGSPVVTRPHSKLRRLCALAAARGGTLTKPEEVARAIELSAGRISQLFGYSQEIQSRAISIDTLTLIAAAFTQDGVPCEVDWFYLEFEEFAACAAAAQSRDSAARVIVTSDAAPGEWQFTEATVLPDLVELRLHPPRAGNEIPDSYYVDATLLFGTADCDFMPDDGEPPRTVSIALSNARLAIGSDSYRPLKGSMLGERGTSENFKRIAGGVEITGPARNGTLEGDPIGEQYLAVVAGTNTASTPFAVTVAANRRSFVVTDSDAPPERRGANAPSDARDAILNVLIYKGLPKDAAGRPVLARATMQRAARDDDAAS